MPEKLPDLVLAAPRSGEGKTTVCLALIRALRRAGFSVRAAKCGPDYVDPTLLEKASGRPCPQLDTWLMGSDGVRSVHARLREDGSVVVCEGVMGLLDGHGSGSLEGSTLDAARTLGLPVFLVLNARGMASSIAPVVEGFQLACRRHGAVLAGVIAARVGSPRHRTMLAGALERAGLPPLVCALARDDSIVLPSRQLGLVPAEELDRLEAVLDRLGGLISDEDLAGLLTAAAKAAPDKAESGPWAKPAWERPAADAIASRILAVARDQAICFYYEENFRLLRALGWEPVFFSPLNDDRLPKADALYLGGGYPEVSAARLAEGRTRHDIRAAAADGLPVFAECGGYMYLAETLETADGKKYPLCGVLPGTARMGSRIRSLGYREARFLTEPPFGLEAAGAGRTARGHEFHWSEMIFSADQTPEPLFREVRNGQEVLSGCVAGPCRNVLAGYLHLWLPSLFRTEQEKARRPGSPQLILLTGPSSAGKSSLQKLLMEKLQTRGLKPRAVSLDGLLSALSLNGQKIQSLEEAEEADLFSAAQYHQLLRKAAAAGLVVCDHVLCGKTAWIADFQAVMAGVSVAAFELSCPEGELILRESLRSDRPGQAAHAAAQAAAQRAKPLAAVFPGTISLNSFEHRPEELSAQALMELDRAADRTGRRR